MHRGLRGAKFTATTLAQVRRRGWAATAAEREPGVASVSAPVRGPGGRVLAAVSVSGPIERLTRLPGRITRRPSWRPETRSARYCAPRREAGPVYLRMRPQADAGRDPAPGQAVGPWPLPVRAMMDIVRFRQNPPHRETDTRSRYEGSCRQGDRAG